MITLRPHQYEAVNELIPKAFREGHRCIIRYAPMRSGKSIEQAAMAKGAYEKGKRTILLTHRTEIFHSTIKHLANQNIPCFDLEAGKKMPAGDWRIMLAMEKTLWNVIAKSPTSILTPNLLLIDEIQFQNFDKIINYFKEKNNNLFVVGFSGTPIGKHLHKTYTKIIHNVDPHDLVNQGLLTRASSFQMQDEEGFEDVKVSKGEFNTNDLFKKFDKPKKYEGLLKQYKEKVFGKKGIVFCVNIEHTVKTFQMFKSEGLNAFMVHSGNKIYKFRKSERKPILKAFELSTDGIMINNGILSTGYDHPPLEWVALDRAIYSFALFNQMATRPATPYPGKEKYIILDFGLNHNRHCRIEKDFIPNVGMIHQPITWSLDPPKKKKIQAAPSKICPGCSALLFASAMKCEFCGQIFEKKTSELREGIMVCVDSGVPVDMKGKRIGDLTIQELLDLDKVKKYKASFIWRCVRSRGAEAIKEYAELKGYKSGWISNQEFEITKGNVGHTNFIIK